LVPVIRLFCAFYRALFRIIAKSGYQLRHVRLSVRTHNDFGSHWTDSREILCWVLLRKSMERLQVWLKSDKRKIPDTVHEDLKYVLLFAAT